jgi:hypothetical protein
MGMFLFNLTFVSAESIGTFKQGTNINLTNYCRDGNCSGINITSIKYPNGSSEIINQPMIMNGQEGFYEWSDTLALGTYFFKTTGSNGITDEDSFDITPSGNSGNENIFLYIIILILGYTLNLLGFFNRNSVITSLGGIILVFVGLYMINNGIIIFRDSLTLAISYVTLFWGAGSSLWGIIEEIQDNM